jgi:predicted ester cyclase
MRKIPSVVVAVGLALVACKKKQEEAKPAEPSTKAVTPTPEPAKPPEPAKAVTGDDLAKRYVECWGFFSAKNWDQFKTCYTATTTSEWLDSGMPVVTGTDDIINKNAKPFADAFPDIKGDVELVLINGKNAATFALLTGTHSGTLKAPTGDIPATNKKIGLQVAHVAHFTDDGKAVDKEVFVMDMGEMMAQLGLSKAPARPASDKPWGPTETVIAKDDANEKRNVENAGKLLEAFNKHAAKDLGALMADDLQWSEIGAPKDWNKAEAIKEHEGMFKAFSDIKIATDATWAAGDYVFAQGTMSGTNDGPAPEMGIKAKTGKPLTLKFVQLLKFNKDGKLTRSYGYWNSAAFAMQLGLMPPPAAAKPEGKAGAKPEGKAGGKPAKK